MLVYKIFLAYRSELKALEYIKEKSVKEGKYLEVRGLKGGVEYQV